MRKLVVIFLACMLALLSSCSQNQKNSSKTEKLYIITTLVEQVGSKMITKVEISEISSDYFEVSLSSQSTGGYLANKEIIETVPGEPFKSIFFQISDKECNIIKFLTSTDFLNFMSAHGYELVDQLPNEYGGDYTFKKKK